MDTILHTAPPFHMTAAEPVEVVSPAVFGALSVLKAVYLHGGQSIKHVVVVSSVAAILQDLFSAYVFGPLLHETNKLEDLNKSTRVWFDVIVKATLNNDALAGTGYGLPPAASLKNLVDYGFWQLVVC